MSGRAAGAATRKENGASLGPPGAELANAPAELARAPAERLHDALARRCRGRVLVLEEEEGRLASELGRRGLEVLAGSATDSEAGPAPGEFRTVLIHELLASSSRREAERLLRRAWARVARKGRLIAVVPNAECGNGRGEGLDRRGLDRLLRALGKPKLVTDQPYRWVVMYVEKKRRRGGSAANPSRQDRYGVTAELCRGRVIELGCGEGALSALIAARGCDVLGVDLSERKISAARLAHPHVSFVESDILDLDLPAASFDTAVLAEVLEHVTERPGEEILRAAWRLLRPGGRLVVSVPNEDCVPHRNHLRQFDRKRLAETLRPFGPARWVSEQPFKWLLAYVEKGS